jgi:FecR protein
MGRRRVQALLVAAAALALTAAEPASEARLRAVVGNGEISSGAGSSWRAAQVGDVLAPGGSLRTGGGARAEIGLAAGIARVYERSQASIPGGPEAARRVDLARGAASFDIRRRSDAPFEVHTHEAVALVKGTRFTVTADASGSAVAVQRGLVGVREPGSVAREILIHPGFGVTGGAGRPFALGLLDRKGDPWEVWSHGAAPSRPLPPPPDANLPPASADGTEVVLQGEGNVSIRVLAERGPKRIQVTGTSGLDATLTKRDLDRVLRGNSAVLGSELLAMLRMRGVTPAAFAHQVLDNL